MNISIALPAAVFGLFATCAFAQAPADAPQPAPPAADSGPEPPPPPQEQPRKNEARADHYWHSQPRERGARFRIESGRTRIDLRCADGESTKECADTVLQLLEHLQTPTSGNSDRNGYDRGDRWERD
ncbi:putative component of type VI protein secretion system [Rhizobium sp. BK529]|nr:putative component of type VI protein secretion system [Rhizobium sp. BK529]TCS01512.1 hypothetical protein EV281_106257 [Rhizobium sp. BK418]